MTGGGSAGHVTPNLALVPSLKKSGYDIRYIGSKDGIEKGIIESEKIKYFGISSGKLRRYFDIKNFTDPFNVIKGIFEAKKIIKVEKPNIVFSKGGFVSVPVVIAAKLCKVPVITHESDYSPGLANKISMPFCNKVCVTFPESLKKIKKDKGVLTGTPIREALFKGNKAKGLKICGFSNDKPILLIIGGSLGSVTINETIRSCIDDILIEYNIIHICGKGNIDKNLKNKEGYKQFEYVNDELTHLMYAADVVISRAGANAIFELLALKKPNILIPLSKKSSRGDQILNADSFSRNGYSLVIHEEALSKELLLQKLKEMSNNKDKFINAMNNCEIDNGVKNIVNVIKKYSIK
jgi:UDP-N-acetylglucosamine--N-acetylmuramyl-(pentapeptide) pyrophosphoryl-undecaprenol N-acetylglucosamine transferase